MEYQTRRFESLTYRVYALRHCSLCRAAAEASLGAYVDSYAAEDCSSVCAAHTLHAYENGKIEEEEAAVDAVAVVVAVEDEVVAVVVAFKIHKCYNG